ncbi:MAG: winged helix-turn-helix domain-containing protein [Anaerolineales bacterium]|nr:winged helix-turn-helix domain-containing protein [Anaerolineales bacterium]
MRIFLLLPKNRTRHTLILELQKHQTFLLQGFADCFANINLVDLISNPPHILVTNFDEPEAHELRLWAVLKSLLPRETRIVALTGGADFNTLEVILVLGVHALQPIRISAKRLIEAIEKASVGQVDFDPELADRAKELFLNPLGDSLVNAGGLNISLQRPIVLRWGQEIALSSLEAQVLQYLASHIDRWVSIDELLNSVWKTDKQSGGTKDQVKSCIKRLRAKIEPDRSYPRYIISSRSEGYRLNNPF